VIFTFLVTFILVKDQPAGRKQLICTANRHLLLHKP